jgi:hypothetical protein
MDTEEASGGGVTNGAAGCHRVVGKWVGGGDAEEEEVHNESESKRRRRRGADRSPMKKTSRGRQQLPDEEDSNHRITEPFHIFLMFFIVQEMEEVSFVLLQQITS